jgi:hypothetical protein
MPRLPSPVASVLAGLRHVFHRLVNRSTMVNREFSLNLLLVHSGPVSHVLKHCPRLSMLARIDQKDRLAHQSLFDA